jgi:hypothetical protein
MRGKCNFFKRKMHFDNKELQETEKSQIKTQYHAFTSSAPFVSA